MEMPSIGVIFQGFLTSSDHQNYYRWPLNARVLLAIALDQPSHMVLTQTPVATLWGKILIHHIKVVNAGHQSQNTYFSLKTSFVLAARPIYRIYITYHKIDLFLKTTFVPPGCSTSPHPSSSLRSLQSKLPLHRRSFATQPVFVICIYENICICICIKVFNNITSTPLALELFGATSAVCLIIERCKHFEPLFRSADQDTSYQDKL